MINNNSNIQQKTISGMFYSFLGLSLNNVIMFIISIILARLLQPSDFGLLGMVIVFITISSIFIDSGMTNALIREKTISNIEYSTVFYFNLLLSIFAYFVLYFTSGIVSGFFNEPQLIPIIKVLSLGLIVGAFGNIQRTKLTKALNFKSQTKIDIISSITSGLIGIFLAYNGKGVWALVIMGLIKTAVTSLLLMITEKWTPLKVFDINAFKRFFKFGYKLLITGLLATMYRNVYNLILGRYYSTEILGYYAKSYNLKDMISTSILMTVTKVGYPILSSIKEEKERFSSGFKRIIKYVSYLSFPVFFGMIAISEPMIFLLFGEKWISMIPYFRVLSISAIVFPQGALNLNILQIVGRSDLFLKIDTIKILIGLMLIFISVFFGFGLNGLFLTIILMSIISFIANTYYSKYYINYSMYQQIKDLFPALAISIVMALIVYSLSLLLALSIIVNLLIMIITGIVSYIGLSIFLKVEEFNDIKDILFNLLKEVKSNKSHRKKLR